MRPNTYDAQRDNSREFKTLTLPVDSIFSRFKNGNGGAILIKSKVPKKTIDSESSVFGRPESSNGCSKRKQSRMQENTRLSKQGRTRGKKSRDSFKRAQESTHEAAISELQDFRLGKLVQGAGHFALVALLVVLHEGSVFRFPILFMC